MKKSKVIAGICAAVICCGIISVPGTAEVNGTAVVYADSELSAPTGVKTSCSGNDLIVRWDPVKGASAYRIYVRFPWSNIFVYENYKTVKSTKVKIGKLVYGNKVSVKIVPLKKTSSGYTEGTATFITKKFVGKRAGLTEEGLFLFDASLIGKSVSYVSKALKSDMELEYWPWWTHSGSELRIAFVEYNGINLALLFNDKNKLVQAYYDTPFENYSDTIDEKADEMFANRTDYSDRDNELLIAFTVLHVDNVGFQLQKEIYAETGEAYLRQEYFAR